MTKHTKKKVHHGCLNCPRTEDILPLDEVLYNGFGGYKVLRNNETVYEGDPQGEWESFKTLAVFEEAAQKSKADWKVVLYTPLRGATWQRKGKNKWVLIESNNGFA